jgi:hypothetical protein
MNSKFHGAFFKAILPLWHCIREKIFEAFGLNSNVKNTAAKIRLIVGQLW